MQDSSPDNRGRGLRQTVVCRVIGRTDQRSGERTFKWDREELQSWREGKTLQVLTQFSCFFIIDRLSFFMRNLRYMDWEALTQLDFPGYFCKCVKSTCSYFVCQHESKALESELCPT